MIAPRVNQLAMWLACVGMCLPTIPLFAQTPKAPQLEGSEEPARARPVLVADIKLGPEGSLRGMLVDPQGLPMPNTEVAVLRGGQTVGTATTDLLGQFQVSHLQCGVYQVVAAQGGATLRAWESHAAPPAAKPFALVVGGSEVVRGHRPWRRPFVSDAFTIAAIIVAAVAIPVVISDSRNVHPSSS
jgi:hypothetical protein